MTAEGERESPTDRVRAFVPGHVTGFFSVHRHHDPEKAGSRGAGLSLTDGVTVALEPADSIEVVLDGDPVEMESVVRTLDSLGVEARATVKSSVPVSAGFGVSGGAALGTALVANQQFGLAHTETELVGIAHAAEVEAGTGLGDVVAQTHGGVPLRLDPGVPPEGRLDSIPVRPTRIEYVSFGGRSTGKIIGGDIVTLTAAGEHALGALRERPTLTRLLALSRTFAREADLLTSAAETAIDAVDEAGGEAAMAMLGDTVVALGEGLSMAGYDPVVCEVDPAGARLV